MKQIKFASRKCFYDGKEIKDIRSIKFEQDVETIPTFNIEVLAYPEIESDGLVIFDFQPQNVIDAVKVLRNELLKHEDVYDGFVASLESALNDYWCCGLPFEPEHDVAKKILDRIIGED